MEGVGDGVEVLGLGYTLVVYDVVGSTDGASAGVSGFDEGLGYVADVYDGDNVVAAAEEACMAGGDEVDEAGEAGCVTRSVNPAGADDYDGGTALFDEFED